MQTFKIITETNAESSTELGVLHLTLRKKMAKNDLELKWWQPQHIHVMLL
jgi:hypothetical protein